jgi:hypothetical protein
MRAGGKTFHAAREEKFEKAQPEIGPPLPELLKRQVGQFQTRETTRIPAPAAIGLQRI